MSDKKTMWRVVYWRGSIAPYEIKGMTRHRVMYIDTDGRHYPENKKTENHSWHETPEEAEKALLQYAQKEVDLAQKRLDAAKLFLQKVKNEAK